MTLRTHPHELDCAAESDRICEFIRTSVVNTLKKKGAIVAVSGGIDSSTTAALCVRALGVNNVYALLLPERDSSPDSTYFAQKLVKHLGVRSEIVDITPILDAMGCYRCRDESIRELFPHYSPAFRSKIVVSSPPLGKALMSFFSVVIEGPDGAQQRMRLPLKNYLQIVAATNMKQRTRKSIEYYHADRLNYAVAGTPNFLEYDQGFFVKQGDGAADLKPIAHLYKMQVYAMARYLAMPEILLNRKPTTDTYSLEQNQSEFYFHIDYSALDLVIHGLDTGLEITSISRQTGIAPHDLEWIIEDIKRKRVATHPLHLAPLTLVAEHATELNL